ncbi:MAG: M12 family metallopeptidase [Solitalea-like symbiont of Tyrophagus putrescentiae]
MWQSGHALGFIHEHQRPCRDTFLKVDTTTIDYIKGEYNNDQDFLQSFDNEYMNTDPVYNDDFAFDYESIMIYPSYGNHLLPIGSTAPGNHLVEILIGQNRALYKRRDNEAIIDIPTRLSGLDIRRTNMVYPRSRPL